MKNLKQDKSKKKKRKKVTRIFQWLNKFINSLSTPSILKQQFILLHRERETGLHLSMLYFEFLFHMPSTSPFKTTIRALPAKDLLDGSMAEYEKQKKKELLLFHHKFGAYAEPLSVT